MVNVQGRQRLAIGIFATAALGLAMALPQVMSPRANEAVDPTVTGSIRATPSAAASGVSTVFRKALALVADGKHAEGYELARGIADATERRAVQWAAITFGNGAVPSDAMQRFAADAPDFVKTSSFRSRLEQALVKEAAAAPEVIAALGGATPNTIDGQIALAVAYRAAGETARATTIARSLWVDNFLERAAEDKVLAELGDLLDRAAHWDRAVHLMMHDRASAVERLFDQMTSAQKSLAVARNATSRNDKNAKQLLDSVDASMTDNPVFYFSRAQRARQFELWDDAIDWLDKAKGEVPDAAEFWYERRLLVRQLLARGEVKRAYRAAAGYTEGPEGRLVEAQFHAGWIALSFLRDPGTAAGHFRLMRQHSTLPDSVTQADYWLGRSLDATGDTAGARRAWADAAAYGTIYYGQLARAALGEPAVGIRPMPEWKAAEAGFESRELVRAVRLLADNGEKAMAATLLRSFAFDLQDGADLLQAARLAQSLGSHHLAIAIADTSERRGAPLDLFNFPKDGLPRQQLASVDHAAVYAVARQESRFQLDAVSSAGARGLMQLMPGTAKGDRRKLGLSYSVNRLTSDGAYNALLGSTYLKAQLEAFDGSLLLAAAAYNAGPGNVRKWLAAYGDPRSDKIDPVVWVELIPMLETRKYVQRVLGNYLVYRARLGLDELSITEALRRIRGKPAREFCYGFGMLLRARTVPAGLKALQSLPVELITVGPQHERMAVCVLGRIAGGQVPLICVPGHHRNMADFAGFANQFRRQIGEDWPVVLVDLKGRGRSSDRSNKALYASPVDAEDLAQVAAALAIERAIFVGQGYGGQVAMALAARHANLIAGTVLLDAGPVSDPRGLVRLRNNLRILGGNRSEAGFRAMTRRILATDYPATPEHILDELAGRTHYLDKRSRVRMLFDPYLIEMLERFEHDDILVPQWQLFGALAEAPLLLMRTQLTEQLRRETFEEMLRRRRDAEGYVIEGQGSPALLNTAEDVEPIAEFVRRTAGLRRAAA